MKYTIGDKIAEVVFDKPHQYSEAQELAYKFDKWLENKTKEDVIKLLKLIGI